MSRRLLDEKHEHNEAGPITCCSPLPYVTQDNTPPGPRFSKLGYSAPSTIPIPTDTFSENYYCCRRDFYNDTTTPCLISTLILIRSNRALNRSKGGVLYCVTCVESSTTVCFALGSRDRHENATTLVVLIPRSVFTCSTIRTAVPPHPYVCMWNHTKET